MGEKKKREKESETMQSEHVTCTYLKCELYEQVFAEKKCIEIIKLILSESSGELSKDQQCKIYTSFIHKTNTSEVSKAVLVKL